MKIRLASLAVAMAAVTALSAQSPAPKRSISEKDLFEFVWVANPQLSPDGSRVAFTRVTVDEKRTGYESSIWAVSTTGKDAPVRMTAGRHDSQPRWSPDGSRLAFVRGFDKDEAGKPRPPQIAVLSLNGGEARIVTDLPKGAAGPTWSPDGTRLAFLSTTVPADLAKAARAKDAAGPAGATGGERESDVHIIARAVYRSNDEGYLDPGRHRHIWVMEVTTAPDDPVKPTQLTSGNFDEREITWANDGARVYFLTSRVDEPYYEQPTTELD